MAGKSPGQTLEASHARLAAILGEMAFNLVKKRISLSQTTSWLRILREVADDLEGSVKRG